jgi:hypothetical protein
VISRGINAYNAVTVRGILREYPTSSIQNHAAKWLGYNIRKDLLLLVGGQPYSLDQIEHEILRKLDEPRIHFAIVCASRSWPRLGNRAYTAADLENQLDFNTQAFFADPGNFLSWTIAVLSMLVVSPSLAQSGTRHACALQPSFGGSPGANGGWNGGWLRALCDGAACAAGIPDDSAITARGTFGADGNDRVPAFPGLPVVIHCWAFVQRAVPVQRRTRHHAIPGFPTRPEDHPQAAVWPVRLRDQLPTTPFRCARPTAMPVWIHRPCYSVPTIRPAVRSAKGWG